MQFVIHSIPDNATATMKRSGERTSHPSTSISRFMGASLHLLGISSCDDGHVAWSMKLKSSASAHFKHQATPSKHSKKAKKTKKTKKEPKHKKAFYITPAFRVFYHLHESP
jgi:hypothetical protein